MAKNLARSHALILPLVLLVMVLLEEIATVEARARIASLPLRVAVLMALYGAGFAFAAGTVAPWLKKALVSARREARPVLGPWGFYLVAYGALYAAFYAWERWGATVLPSSIVQEWLG
jgi:hypothetical protein